MLVLSRKQKQQIRIGDDVVVTILHIKGGSVRIGIEAPREIHVMRGELESFQEPQQNQPVEPAREILSMRAATHSGEQGSAEEQSEDQAEPGVLELKFQGGKSKGGIVPTRLTEIANSIPSLNLPR